MSDNLKKEILEKTSIYQILRENGLIKKDGKYDCLICNKKECFKIDSSENFECSECKNIGNIITFISLTQKISPEDAIKYLATKVNINLNKYNLPEIELPLDNKLVTDFAKELSKILPQTTMVFFRPESRDIVEINTIKEKDKDEKDILQTKIISIKPARFITLIEQFLTPGKIIHHKTYGDIFIKKSISVELANTLLQSSILANSLPQIKRIFTIPLPIIYDGQLTFPKQGYDERFKSWLPYNSPKICDLMTLKEAKQLIFEMLHEFCFMDKQDYTNAVAGLITPFLRGLYSSFNERTPVFIYIANRERAGKDYLAGVTGILLEGFPLQEAAISTSDDGKFGNNSDEVRKKIISYLISGKKRYHSANNKGYINNSSYEGIITAPVWSDRILGRNQEVTFNNEMEFSLSGNIGIGFTPDLANRSRFIKLHLEIEDANAREFEKPNLHQWILENREKIITAIYVLIKNWFDTGCKSGTIPFSSFPEWSRVCGGIMEAAGYDSPCKKEDYKLEIGGDSETSDTKQLFEICFERYPQQEITKDTIKTIIEEFELFNNLKLYNKSDQTKFGYILSKMNKRIFSNIRLTIKNDDKRSSQKRYIFTKYNPEKNKQLIFGEDFVTDDKLQKKQSIANVTLSPMQPFISGSPKNRFYIREYIPGDIGDTKNERLDIHCFDVSPTDNKLGEDKDSNIIDDEVVKDDE